MYWICIQIYYFMVKVRFIVEKFFYIKFWKVKGRNPYTLPQWTKLFKRILNRKNIKSTVSRVKKFSKPTFINTFLWTLPRFRYLIDRKELARAQLTFKNCFFYLFGTVLVRVDRFQRTNEIFYHHDFLWHFKWRMSFTYPN